MRYYYLTPSPLSGQGYHEEASDALSHRPDYDLGGQPTPAPSAQISEILSFQFP